MSPNINPEYIISLQGQEYCTYKGVLDRAHSLGLEGIRTRIIQVPNAENEFVAIVEAEVRLNDGRVFVDLADASPKNVPPRLVSALIRMASTRAKGRALRDAVNIGEALAEEMPDMDAEQGAHTAQSRPAHASGSVPRASLHSAKAPGPATGNGSHREMPGAGVPPVREQPAADYKAETPAFLPRETPPAADPTPKEPPATVRPAQQAPPPTIPAQHTAPPAASPTQQAAPPTAPAQPPAVTPAQQAPPPAPAPQETRPEDLACSNPGCGRVLTQGQYDYSIRAFGIALCPRCQRTQTTREKSA